MVISIASQKGGTGKTTTSISLAAGLTRRGFNTLLIDTDSQANSSKVLLPNYEALRPQDTLYSTILDRHPLKLHDTSIPRLSLAPSHILLSNTDIALTTALDHREERLRRALDAVLPSFDHVIIDCPPSLSWLTINALTASDKVLVVVAPGYFELDSIIQISKTIAEVRDFYNPKLQLLGYLFTMSDPTVNTKISLKVLRQTYTDEVLRTIIPRNTDIRDAHFNKQDIFTFSPQSKSALAYDRLIDEVFNYEKETQ